ncbi:MAG TPA: 3'-5' exonuclease [Candidatus Margulisiibacteriota bacterium]|nr:3'-5' exonuclease [Candidatus Margulisiibacteriota bacterium]
MSPSLKEAEFVILDTETTGLEPESGDRIVEIAAIRFRGKEKIAVFENLVDPKRNISEGAFSVNGITQDMLRGAPEIKEVLPKFMEFIRGSCLCSYNAAFDLGFLNNELNFLGEPRLNGLPVVDILKMARRLLPGLQRYALSSVAENLGVARKQVHRALEDVELAAEVFFRLRDIAESNRVIPYEEFLSLFGIPYP